MTIQRSVLVALLLLGSAGSAAAWPALPAAAAEEPAPVAPPAPAEPPAPVFAPSPVFAPPVVRPRPASPPVLIEQEPPPGTTAGEWGRAGGQILLGTVTLALVSGAGIGIGEIVDQPAAAILMILAAPVAGGFVVCGVGRTSHYYDGGCGPAIGGAYLGALTGIPLALIIAESCEPDPAYASYEGRAGECLGPALFGFALGYTVGAALGATIGWHLGKKPRPAAAPAPPLMPPSRDERLQLGRGPSPSPGRGLRLTLPVLAFSF